MNKQTFCTFEWKSHNDCDRRVTCVFFRPNNRTKTTEPPLARWMEITRAQLRWYNEHFSRAFSRRHYFFHLNYILSAEHAAIMLSFALSPPAFHGWRVVGLGVFPRSCQCFHASRRRYRSRTICSAQGKSATSAFRVLFVQWRFEEPEDGGFALAMCPAGIVLQGQLDLWTHFLTAHRSVCCNRVKKHASNNRTGVVFISLWC